MIRPVAGDRILSDAYLRRGITSLCRNEFAAAVVDFDEALRFVPDDCYAHWNKATALLSLGDYANGFREHEWGWRLFNWRGFGPVREDIDRVVRLPLFRLNPSVSDAFPARLLCYHELGFGDAIMVMRFLPKLAATAQITLVIDAALARLAQRFGVDVATRVPDDLGTFDCRLPFFGVMAALGETRETIPREPYIAANWQRGGGEIGVAWSGRTQRMFEAQTFLPLLNIAGYRLNALQPGPAPRHVAKLDAEDFEDTIAVIERMDHVVTVDTAVAHLAGAMGHPSVHVVVPFLSDWRWWHADVWYPTVKVYRQPQTGDWSEPFARVRAAIERQ